jgi:hypothetical protein
MKLELNDTELDRLLAKATMPKPSRNLAESFFEKPSDVVAFAPRKKTTPWFVGLPLAASLVLGLWLGGATNFTDTTQVADETNVDDLISLIESDV